MKSRILVLGVVVAAISAFSLTAAAQEQPAVKIIPGAESNTIKLVFGYETQSPVDVKFSGTEGLISFDRISGKISEHGFIKKYQVNRQKSDAFWVEVNCKDVAVTYKLTAQKNGKWLAQLEQATYNYPAVASR